MREGEYFNATDLIQACKRGETERVRAILKDETVDREVDDSACLYWACHNGHTEIVHALLVDDRADPDAGDNKAICAAAEFGYTHIVRMLLQHGRADPSAGNNLPLVLACVNGHAEVVRLLLQDPYVDPTYDHSICLGSACIRGHADVVQVLLDDGRVLNAVAGPRHARELGRYLETACERGHVDVVKQLVERTSIDHYPGLRAACKHDQVEVVECITRKYPFVQPSDLYVSRWITRNVVTHNGCWLHQRYVERTHAIAWCLWQMGQIDLPYMMIPYFMKTRIQNTKTRTTQVADAFVRGRSEFYRIVIARDNARLLILYSLLFFVTAMFWIFIMIKTPW